MRKHTPYFTPSVPQSCHPAAQKTVAIYARIDGDDAYMLKAQAGELSATAPISQKKNGSFCRTAIPDMSHMRNLKQSRLTENLWRTITGRFSKTALTSESSCQTCTGARSSVLCAGGSCVPLFSKEAMTSAISVRT